MPSRWTEFLWLLLSVRSAWSATVDSVQGFRLTVGNNTLEKRQTLTLFQLQWAKQNTKDFGFCNLLSLALKSELPKSHEAFLTCVAEQKTSEDTFADIYFKTKNSGESISDCPDKLAKKIEEALNKPLSEECFAVIAHPRKTKLRRFYYRGVLTGLAESETVDKLQKPGSWENIKYTGLIMDKVTNLLMGKTGEAEFRGIRLKKYCGKLEDYSMWYRIYYKIHAYFYIYGIAEDEEKCSDRIAEVLARTDGEGYIDGSVSFTGIQPNVMSGMATMMESMCDHEKSESYDEPIISECEATLLPATFSDAIPPDVIAGEENIETGNLPIRPKKLYTTTTNTARSFVPTMSTVVQVVGILNILLQYNT